MDRQLTLFRDMETGEVVLMRREPQVWGDLIPQLWAEVGRRPAAETSIRQLCDLVVTGLTAEQMYQQMQEESET